MDSRFGGRGGGYGGDAGGSSPNGQRAGDGKRAVVATKPLRPATIYQIQHAEHVGDGALVIDGRETGQVTLVGRIVEMEAGPQTDPSQPRSFTYKVCDSTGYITVRHWSNAAMDELEVGSYIRASGTISQFQGQPVITGMVRAAPQCDELTYHLLDCMLTHDRMTAGPKAQPSATQHHAHSANIPHAAVAAAHPPSFVGAPRDMVLNCIKSYPQGITVSDITANVTQYGIQGQVRDILRGLTTEGSIFIQGNVVYCQQ